MKAQKIQAYSTEQLEHMLNDIESDLIFSRPTIAASSSGSRPPR